MSYNIIVVPPGQYNGITLAAWFKSEINVMGAGQWTVVCDGSNTITCATLNIANFKIFTDDK